MLAFLKWSAALLLKWGTAFVASTIIAIPAAIWALLGMMALDILSGVIVAAVIEHNLSAKIYCAGIAKKVLMLLVCAAAHLAMKPLNLGFDAGVMVASAYILNELISIMENCDRGNVPLPAWLLSALLRTKSLSVANSKELEGMQKKSD